MTKGPSKKEFADWINQVAGMPVMDEKRLDAVMQGAGKAAREKGLDGLFDYLRRLTGAPVSNNWMREVWNQLATPQGMAKWSRELAPGVRKAPGSSGPASQKRGKKES